MRYRRSVDTSVIGKSVLWVTHMTNPTAREFQGARGRPRRSTIDQLSGRHRIQILMNSLSRIGVFYVAAVLARATEPAPASAQTRAAVQTELSKSLIFHASFDHGFDADFARGDRAIYSAPSYRLFDAAKAGVASPDVVIAKGQGRFGD